MHIRLDTPGFVSRSKRTTPSESVTARLNLRTMASLSSVIRIKLLMFVSDLLIFLVGSASDMILAPAAGT